MSNHVDIALLEGFADLPASDQDELRKFVGLLERRRDKPNECPVHAVADHYGEGVVVFEDRPSVTGSEDVNRG